MGWYSIYACMGGVLYLCCMNDTFGGFLDVDSNYDVLCNTSVNMAS